MKKQTNIIIITILVILLSAIFSEIALSHPHVFIAQRIKIVFDDNGLAGFNIQWEFDEMFTSMIVEDHDKNQNKMFEANEVALIKKEAFLYVSNYNYFTFVRINGKKFDVKFIKNFSARLSNHKLLYVFFIPCHVAATNNFKQVLINSYDPSYYTALFFSDKDPVVLENSEACEIKTAIKEDESTSIYYGQINPWALFLDFRKKQ